MREPPGSMPDVRSCGSGTISCNFRRPDSGLNWAAENPSWFGCGRHLPSRLRLASISPTMIFVCASDGQPDGSWNAVLPADRARLIQSPDAGRSEIPDEGRYRAGCAPIPSLSSAARRSCCRGRTRQRLCAVRPKSMHIRRMPESGNLKKPAIRGL
jgi:hypothetical protein